MIELVVILLFFAGWWLKDAYFHPWKPCPSCKGSGKNPGSDGKRHGKCRRCKGAREVQPFGARQLHRSIEKQRRRRKQS